MATRKPRIISLQELMLSKRQSRIKPDNEWLFNPNNLTIEHRIRPHYYVDLERCESSAAVLDWIFQVYRKSWCTAKTIHDLLDHIQEQLDPQANLCSWALNSQRKNSTTT